LILRGPPEAGVRSRFAPTRYPPSGNRRQKIFLTASLTARPRFSAFSAAVARDKSAGVVKTFDESASTLRIALVQVTQTSLIGCSRS
jgi:hypothetical protein